ncbi:MAG: hypothetical protein KF784_04365 [Fimbriimonadaceae bacterium]|nr:hypothetical protein [Fimbriimonadaceae bacterium]
MLTTLTLAALIGQAQATEPNAQNYRSLIATIQPDAKEEAYKDIGWRNQFWPAVQEAKRLGRPLLFWTMNGHPLGCT